MEKVIYEGLKRARSLLFNNACILNWKQKTNDKCNSYYDSFSVTVRLCVQIRVRLDSSLMNWTSTREYLEQTRTNNKYFLKR